MIAQVTTAASEAEHEAPVQAEAGDDARQPRLGDQRRRLRPAERQRVLERALEQHRDEEQHDEVEEQRRHHLVDAEADLEERRAEEQQRAGERPR